MAAKKKYTIITPNDHFTGKRDGVMFRNGKGVTTDREQAERLIREWGYKCPVLEKTEKK